MRCSAPRNSIAAVFATSRLAEFTSVKELTAQTGHHPEQWALVIVKELPDNRREAVHGIAEDRKGRP